MEPEGVCLLRKWEKKDCTANASTAGLLQLVRHAFYSKKWKGGLHVVDAQRHRYCLGGLRWGWNRTTSSPVGTSYPRNLTRVGKWIGKYPGGRDQPSSVFPWPCWIRPARRPDRHRLATSAYFYRIGGAGKLPPVAFGPTGLRLSLAGLDRVPEPPTHVYNNMGGGYNFRTKFGHAAKPGKIWARRPVWDFVCWMYYHLFGSLCI